MYKVDVWKVVLLIFLFEKKIVEVILVVDVDGVVLGVEIDVVVLVVVVLIVFDEVCLFLKDMKLIVLLEVGEVLIVYYCDYLDFIWVEDGKLMVKVVQVCCEFKEVGLFVFEVEDYFVVFLGLVGLDENVKMVVVMWFEMEFSVVVLIYVLDVMWGCVDLNWIL